MTLAKLKKISQLNRPPTYDIYRSYYFLKIEKFYRFNEFYIDFHEVKQFLIKFSKKTSNSGLCDRALVKSIIRAVCQDFGLLSDLPATIVQTFVRSFQNFAPSYFLVRPCQTQQVSGKTFVRPLVKIIIKPSLFIVLLYCVALYTKCSDQRSLGSGPSTWISYLTFIRRTSEKLRLIMPECFHNPE